MSRSFVVFFMANMLGKIAVRVLQTYYFFPEKERIYIIPIFFLPSYKTKVVSPWNEFVNVILQARRENASGKQARWRSLEQ